MLSLDGFIQKQNGSVQPPSILLLQEQKCWCFSATNMVFNETNQNGKGLERTFPKLHNEEVHFYYATSISQKLVWKSKTQITLQNAQNSSWPQGLHL